MIERRTAFSPNQGFAQEERVFNFSFPRFFPETKRLLEEDHFVCELEGMSIGEVRRASNGFWPQLQEGDRGFEALVSRRGQVAVSVVRPFLANSSRKVLSEPIGLVDQENNRFRREFIGAKLVIGEAADYVELGFKYFQHYKRRLFGDRYNDYSEPVFTVSNTTVDEATIAVVGPFNSCGGLDVATWSSAFRFKSVGVVCLVVPS